jgi:Holliday junction resolvase RusA-like endonuclease
VPKQAEKRRRRRRKTKLTLAGRPITKKNSQSFVTLKNGRKFLLQKPAYLQYEKECLWQIKAQYKGEMITSKISLQVHYYMPDKRVPDLINLLQATADILEKAMVIDNDKNIISLDGSAIIGIDKINPRCEITIEGR